ncbi:MAG: hypothetical protein KBG15_11450 [Kofleriaceae bacterium]|nr:hypothetical protein [Kofleriaceae bacterium]
MRIGLLALLTLGPLAARADTPPVSYPTITLSVGGSYEQLAEPGQQCICDDKTLVKPEYAGDKIRLIGIKAGRTLCGFTHFIDGKYLGNLVYEVTVTPAKTAPSKAAPGKPSKPPQ